MAFLGEFIGLRVCDVFESRGRGNPKPDPKQLGYCPHPVTVYNRDQMKGIKGSIS